MTKKYYSLTNKKFDVFCDAFQSLCGCNLKAEKALSTLKEASRDEESCFYDGYSDMDALIPDEMTKCFQQYMKTRIGSQLFEQPHAVDALCIDDNNEWYVIEFKNRPIRDKNKNGAGYDKKVTNSIREKMADTLWFLYSVCSMSGFKLTIDDFTEFARNHITFITVVSREKNSEEAQRIIYSQTNYYTPDFLKSSVGYYFRDAYLFTEKELQRFVINFKH